MSSDADAAATVALFSSFYTESYCAVAASVLFIYEAFVTFDQEVACFWTAKRNGAALLFFANKWFSMLYYVMSAATTFAPFPSDKRLACSTFIISITAVGVLPFITGAVVLSRSKFLGLLVFALSLAPAGANLVASGYQLSGENVPPFGCVQTDNTTVALDLRRRSSVVIISRVPLIVADILLICITWTKLNSRSALKGIQQSRRLSLSDILFRDGTIYFIVLFILNVLHLTLSLVAAAGSAGGSDVTIFTGPITAILVSRFLLELQEANQRDLVLGPNASMHSSRNPYDASSFMSSLGGFIIPDVSGRSAYDSELHFGSRSEAREEDGQASQASESAASPFST
ncbi:hypothetical protein K466DRAFT_664555 [Polyporus arcularius HHB13444]|uniref:DUF6533 domain-containing protein n=1 Tax=Polyporus arcularius HHB13444 TaxID=1314778 RepID=A0A5C3P8Z1_9APHY|nr:hypothetical protein K466DRAFT_664555 [Polyporus arcularius HHB13444]